MHETTADVRRDIEETRDRVSRTLAELESEVGSRKEIVVERVVALRDGVSSAGATVQETVADFAREHPWYALATAVGIGLVIARSRVDEAAAKATVEGTKRAAGATAAATTSAARAGMDKAKGIVQRNGDGNSDTVSVAAEPGLLDRLGSGIFESLGGNDLLESMRTEAARIGRA